MILFIERIGGDKSRETYRLNKPQDFEPLFAEYPATRGMAEFSQSMEDAVDSICAYLSRHHLDAWVEKDGLTKGLRDVALGLSMAAASALAPAATAAPHAQPVQPAVVQQAGDQSFGTQPEDRFLWNISEVESANGKNTNHKKILHGKYKGNTAIGRWGMLRPTIMEMLGRMGQKAPLKPEYAGIADMSRDQIAQHFQKHPEVEVGLARFIARHVLHRQRGDEHKAAYAWTMGHNLFPHQIDPNDLQGHFYVEMYKKAAKKNPMKAAAVKRLRTAMHPTQILKSEDKAQFNSRLADWKAKRFEEARARQPEDSSHSWDPGRIRDDEKLEGPQTQNERVKQALKQMSEGKK